MQKFIQGLSHIYPVSPALQEHLLEKLQLIELPKKSYLLKEGKICKNIYFINQGLARCFYIKEDKEVSSWFMKEGDLIISVESFFTQKPSYETIQAIEDCELFGLSYEDLHVIYYKYPEFNFIARVLTEKYYTLSEQRLFSLRMQRASERYAYLMDHHPEIIQRVPSTFIASYLGITLETLSRIKHV